MIYDTAGNPITSTALTVAPDAEKAFSALVDCRPGYVLKGSTANPDVGLFGRADPGDAWTDLLTGELDTEPFAPQRKLFYFKITAADGADPSTEIVTLTCERS